jgi:HIRAN domain
MSASTAAELLRCSGAVHSVRATIWAAVSRYQRPVTCFYAKVAGVTYDNRQATITKLGALETLDLVPEPDNPHDPNAIKVCRRTGEQIGYLKRDRARRLIEKLKLGHRCTAFVKRVSGGETHYVSITVLVMSPGATDQQVADWINSYDVLGGITVALSPEGELVASPSVDLVPDVSVRRRLDALRITFRAPDDTPPQSTIRGGTVVVVLLLLAVLVLVLVLRS